jgi:hypothetical protein
MEVIMENKKCDKCGLPFYNDMMWQYEYCLCHVKEKRFNEILDKAPKIECKEWTEILSNFADSKDEAYLLSDCMDKWKKLYKEVGFIDFVKSLRGFEIDHSTLRRELEILNSPKPKEGDIIYRDFYYYGESGGVIHITPERPNEENIIKCYFNGTRWITQVLRGHGLICRINKKDKYFTALKVIKVMERSCIVEPIREQEIWTERIKKTAIDFADRTYGNRGKIKVVIDWDYEKEENYHD